MYKLKVKQYGLWCDFVQSDKDRTPVEFKTRNDTEAEKDSRVKMFGPIYKVVEVKG